MAEQNKSIEEVYQELMDLKDSYQDLKEEKEKYEKRWHEESKERLEIVQYKNAFNLLVERLIQSEVERRCENDGKIQSQ